MPSDTTPPLPSDSTRLYSAVDRSNETYEPSPHASRRSIPSGEVSPDGRRAWPRPSLTSRIVVFGGIGIAAAAATAGAVLAVRAIVDGIAGDDDDDDAVEAARKRARARRSGGPRPSQFGPRPASAMRFAGGGSGETDRRREEQERSQRMRREAERRRTASSQGGGGSLVDSVNDTVNSMTHGVRDVLETVTAAIEGFRSVAAQAGDVMGDFNRAADQVKSMIQPATGPATGERRPDPGTYARPAKKDVVDLRDDKPESQDSRSHRL